MAVACRWQHVRVTTTTLSWDVVPVDKPDDFNVVIGQAHFIKTVEDLHEAMVGVSSSLRFGLAFCEASGPRLVRRTGNDPEFVELATRNALAIAAGHCFVIFLRDGYVLDNLADLVVKPIDGAGGNGVIIGPDASDEALETRRRELLSQPERYIAQQTVALSTSSDVQRGGYVPASHRPAPLFTCGRDPATRSRRT